MRKILLLSGIIISSFIGLSQQKEIDTGVEKQKGGYYREAIVNFEAALANAKISEEQKTIVYKGLAECSEKTHNYKKTVDYYGKYLASNPNDLEKYLNYSSALRTVGKTEQAKAFFLKYAEKKGDEKLKAEFNEMIDWAEANGNDATPYVVKVTNIKTNGISMGACEYKEGVLTGQAKSEGEGKTVFYDLGYSKKTAENTFDVPEGISKALSSEYYAGYPSISKDEQTLYFTSNSSDKGKYKPGKTKKTDYSSKGINVLKIFKTELIDGKWSDKEALSFNSNEYSCAHPFITEDGKTLYFVSNMEGSLGGYDVYKSTISKDGVYSKPVNLGKSVNTHLDEMTPSFFNGDLFFSSRGHFGFGGSDIFKATLKNDGSYGKAENVGKPLNSTFDDFAFMPTKSGMTGFFSSNRDGENGEDQIYTFKLVPAEYKVVDKETGEVIAETKITVYEKINGEWIESSVHVSDENGVWGTNFAKNKEYKIVYDNPYYELKEIVLKKNDKRRDKKLAKIKSGVKLKKAVLFGQMIDAITNKTVEGATVDLYEKDDSGNYTKVGSVKTDKYGSWKHNIRRDKEYKVIINRDGYDEKSFEIPAVVSNDPNRSSIIEAMNPMKFNPTAKKNVKLKINNIYFYFAKGKIKEESYPILDNIVEYLNQDTKIKIEVSAHTDCIGKDSYNLSLSKKRAKACFDYLVKHGIEKSRLKSVGYGEKHLLNDCKLQRSDEKAAELNRRVEIKIL